MGLILGSRPKYKAGSGGKSYGVSAKWVSALCIFSFCLGVLVVNGFWTLPNLIHPEKIDTSVRKYVTGDIYPATKCEKKKEPFDRVSHVSQTNNVITTLDKTISSLEMQLVAARAAKAEKEEKYSGMESGLEASNNHPKLLFVMVIITAFSSRKRKDSIRETWMPQGEYLKKLEKEKGIIIRFVIGHSAASGGVLDRAIDAEDAQHRDFLRLNHIEGYHELSAKTQTYFSTAAAMWDANFYIKVDDDVHVNLGIISSLLARHLLKPHVYIGCMKSGPVIAHKGVKYHEPEHWKFGKEGNKYFRHATGQIYAISKALATYISVNRHILHRYANEDVSLGSWFIGLHVEHIEDRSLCCGTAPDCEWKTQAGNPCGASFDWSCRAVYASQLKGWNQFVGVVARVHLGSTPVFDVSTFVDLPSRTLHLHILFLLKL